MTRYAVALGSNLGERLEHLAGAVDQIGRLGDLVAISSLYETEPIGGPEQGPYLNAVMVVETRLSSVGLLRELQAIEALHGRERGERWGPRTLDLDIVAADNEPTDDPELTIPHPRAAEREFVLRPLTEIWPESVVAAETTAAEALKSVSKQGVDLLLSQWFPAPPRGPGRALIGVQILIFLLIAIALVFDGSLPRRISATLLIGAAMAIGGLALVVDAARRLGPALRALPDPAPGAVLVTGGPYRYARHPIYGGLVLLMMGVSLAFGSLLGAAATVLLLVFFWVKSNYEERLLRARFAGYRGYRRTVTRRLVPFVI